VKGTFYDLITLKQGVLLYSLRTVAGILAKCKLDSVGVKVR
jgi:hypothetical protein